MFSMPLLALRGVLGVAPLVVLPFQGAPAHVKVLTIFTRTYAGALSEKQLPVVIASDSPAANACASEHRCEPSPVKDVAVSGYVSAKVEEASTGEVRFSVEARRPSGELVAADSGTATSEASALEALRTSADRLSAVLLKEVPNDAKKIQSYQLASQVTFWGGLSAMAGGGVLLYLAHKNGTSLASGDPSKPPVTVDQAFSLASSERTERILGEVALGVGAATLVASYWCWHKSNTTSQPYVARVSGGAVIGWAGVLP
jgi:hypothetical protein